MDGRAGGYGKVKGAADAFKRGAMENAARSVMNDIHDMAGIGDAGSRAHGSDSYGTGGDFVATALMNREKSDPRTQCTPTDTFSGGIGTQSTRGYRQSGSSGKNGTKSRFDLKKILKNAMFNGLMGGLTDTAFYGMDKAVDAAAVGFLGNQRGSGTQRRIAENESGSGSKFKEVFELADNYKLSDDTFNSHILVRHGPDSTYRSKSHFNADFDIRSGIDSTLRGDNFVVGPNTAGRNGYIFEQTSTNPIGTNSKGKTLYTLKVVIDEAGNVVTSFPKK